ncbi:hypothetical protein T484DRAFT_1795351, partial [Baffinella frigidus]
GHFDAAGLAHTPTPFNGRSDYGPFLENGIPAGGMDTGAEVLKSVELRKVFGGLANAAFDPCYHQAQMKSVELRKVFGGLANAAFDPCYHQARLEECDTFDNLNIPELHAIAGALASVLSKLSTLSDLRGALPAGGAVSPLTIAPGGQISLASQGCCHQC